MKIARRGESFLRARRPEITSASAATISVPTFGPNSSAAVIVNVSEIENVTGIDGIRSVALPLRSVSPRRIET